MTTILDDLLNSASFDVECLPEDADIDGATCDEEDASNVRSQLDSGNEWAWCTVRVVASLGDVEGDAYLGCCSYASKADFMAPGGYYDDMKAEALDNLRSKLDAIIRAVPSSMLSEELESRGIDA